MQSPQRMFTVFVALTLWWQQGQTYLRVLLGFLVLVAVPLSVPLGSVPTTSHRLTLLNRVVKEEKVDASEFANNAFLDKFLPVSEKLGIEAGFILQEHEAGTLNAWLVKQSISRGIRWLGKHPIRDCAILRQILGRFPFGADDNGKISTCNECVQSDMDSVVALLKERVPGYVPAKDEYNGLVEDVLANWEYIWNEAIVYNVLATIVYTNEPKKDFGWYDGLKLLHLVDFAAWQQWCDA